jgi:hypothetical protein
MTANTAVKEEQPFSTETPVGLPCETHPPGSVDSQEYLEIYYSGERTEPPPGEPNYYHYLWLK